MSLIPHGFFPRSAFDMDTWMAPMQMSGPSTMDLFDPFDELDNMISRNLQWLSRPEFVTPALPRVPQKYRITLDCIGYQPNSIKTEIKDNLLTVSGKEEIREEKGDFHTKEFRKTYTLPPHAEGDKLVSFMTGNGQLVIEIPLREIAKHSNDDLFPRVVDVPAGGKAVQMKFHVPETVDPSKVHVSIKDRDLIVKAEDRVEKPDGVSRFYYYKRTTLPENTDFNSLRCNLDNADHSISIDAPLDMNFKKHRSIPITVEKKPALAQK